MDNRDLAAQFDKEPPKTTGLTLKQAVESGRRYRHLGWVKGVWRHANSRYDSVGVEAAISSDWEIEPLPKRKVKKWKWILEERPTGKIKLTRHLAESEAEIEKSWFQLVVGRILESEIEVEE